ncbi:hypothetical protein ACNFJ7_15365 [Sphingomonas sp. HT-1]|uniref:hypothetical protein n=1 Tax=unclassified Sphingomonas TaxID=196159 RepID=UPI0003169EE0|nr:MULTISPECIES: hypothetical protein [unclassified Sphingomonas]
MNDSRDDDLARSPAAQLELVRARQRGRARVMALLLGGFVILVFAISIVKMQLGHGG